MKKGIVLSIALSVAVVLFSLVAFASAPESEVSIVPETKNVKVITVNDSNASADFDKITETRFLNMLNRNFVYNDAYNRVEDIVNDSVIALLDMRESDDSFINQSVVSGFVYDMYGIDVDYSSVNADFPKKDGYLYIIPRGYEIYSHSIISVKENEDGTFTVKTNVKISSHDGTVINDVCETLFVKNEASQFGFNIVYSNIGAPASAI